MFKRRKKPTVVFRMAGTDPTEDEIPIRGANLSTLAGCLAFVLVACALATAGGLFFAYQSGQASASPDDSLPTLAVLPTDTDTPTATLTDTPTATEAGAPTWTPTGTPDDAALTETATASITPPTETITPTPTIAYDYITETPTPPDVVYVTVEVTRIAPPVERTRIYVVEVTVPPAAATYIVTRTNIITAAPVIVVVTATPSPTATATVYISIDPTIDPNLPTPGFTRTFFPPPTLTASSTLAPTATATETPTATPPASSTLAPTATATETPTAEVTAEL